MIPEDILLFFLNCSPKTFIFCAPFDQPDHWNFCALLIKCLISIFQLYKCSLFGFLVVFKDLHCVATTEDVSMGTSSIPNLGLPGKLKVLLKYWCRNSNQICKCKPTVSTCALSLTLPVHYGKDDSWLQ